MPVGDVDAVGTIRKEGGATRLIFGRLVYLSRAEDGVWRVVVLI